jgi:hypothetical protein
MKTLPGILFQQKVFKTTRKPEREFWIVPEQVQVFKDKSYLDISNNRLFGGFGKAEQIKKLCVMQKTDCEYEFSIINKGRFDK